MTRAACPVCGPAGTTPCLLDVPCPVCGTPMGEVSLPGGDLVLHCPQHCATLFLPPAMLTQFTARRN
jgi:hypothetical protein